MAHLGEMRHSHWTIPDYHSCSQNKSPLVKQRFCCGLGGGEIRWHLIRHKQLTGPSGQEWPLPRSYPPGLWLRLQTHRASLRRVVSPGTSFQNFPREAATSGHCPALTSLLLLQSSLHPPLTKRRPGPLLTLRSLKSDGGAHCLPIPATHSTQTYLTPGPLPPQ